ncbi:MAG: hypothetical protein WAQ07_05845 [Candidatus Omnitrophota bacterium]
MKKVFILMLVVLFFVPYLFAETILLKTGQRIEGDIIERTDEYIKISFQGVDLTYYNDEIDSVSQGAANLLSPEKGLGFKPAYSPIDFSALAEHYPIQSDKESFENDNYAEEIMDKDIFNIPTDMPIGELNEGIKHTSPVNLDTAYIIANLPPEYQQLIESIQSDPQNISTALSKLPAEYRSAIEEAMKNMPQIQSYSAGVEKE